MTIENVIVTTTFKYEKEEEDSGYRQSKKFEYLQLELPVPNGKLIYELRVTKEFVDSIELGAKLCKDA